MMPEVGVTLSKIRQLHFGQRFTTLISYELGFIVYGPPHPFRLEPNYKGR